MLSFLSAFYVFCLVSSVCFFDVEGDLITLDEILEAGHVYGRIVNKKVLTVFLFDKPETLFFVKPLHCSCSQSETSLDIDLNKQEFDWVLHHNSRKTLKKHA